VIAVLDASGGIEIVLKRAQSLQFQGALDSAEKVITTSLYPIETANVLWKYYHAKYITRDEAATALKLAEELIDEFVPIRDDCHEALSESLRFDCPAYDMLYLVLTRRTGGTLITLDKGLRRLAESEGLSVV
jgi:predicted nucleic acid-binding protein